MNSDHIKGATKDAAGKVQRKAGEAMGSTEHQAKGTAKQAEGKTQKKVGDLREAASTPRSDKV
ncbi:MAG: CsbD family protein [Comamonadaceae bacterium]|nr:CsbD family protein [Comamonadaceae bacterium]